MVRLAPQVSARFALGLPQVFLNGVPDLGLIRATAERAMSLGVDSLWVQEQLVGRAAVLEPVTLLAHVSAFVPQMTLGVSVLPLPQRSPIELAKQLGTLDHLTDGRLIVGLGLGSVSLAPSIGGLPLDRPVHRFREGLRVMEALWSKGNATVHGEFWTLDGVSMEPKPLQRPRPTLWFGGRHPSALRRAVQLADGWMGAGISQTGEFAQHVTMLRAILAEEGRESSEFAVAKRVLVAIDDNPARAREQARRWVTAYYGADDGRVDAVVSGDREEVTVGLGSVAQAGAHTIVVTPLTHPLEALELLAGGFGLS